MISLSLRQSLRCNRKFRAYASNRGSHPPEIGYMYNGKSTFDRTPLDVFLVRITAVGIVTTSMMITIMIAAIEMPRMRVFFLRIILEGASIVVTRQRGVGSQVSLIAGKVVAGVKARQRDFPQIAAAISEGLHTPIVDAQCRGCAFSPQLPCKGGRGTRSRRCDLLQKR